MLHERGSREALGVVRIVVFSMWLFWLHALPFERLALVREATFTPMGPWMLLPVDAITVESLVALRWGLTALLLLTIVGVRPFQPIAITAALGILLFDSLMKSVQGTLNHAQFGILYVAMILSLFPAGDGLSIMGRARTERSEANYAIPMFASAVVVSLMYALVGARRLQVGGLEIFTSDSIVTYIMLRAADHGPFNFELGMTVATIPAFAAVLKIGFAVVTMAELATPLALLNRWVRGVWLAIMVPFHVMVLLMMNILFWENIILAAMLFSGLPYLIGAKIRSTDPNEKVDPNNIRSTTTVAAAGG